MNAPVPREIWPQYPTRMFSPMAANDMIRNGIRIARYMYSSATSGTPTRATASSSTMPQRSCAIGKICWSAE